MITLTENEKELLDWVRIADFNGTVIDFDKTWDEQHLEDPDAYFDIVNVKTYAKCLKTTKPVVKGLLGSLAKKGVITIMEDVDGDDKPMSWVYINKEQFNMIKESLGK